MGAYYIVVNHDKREFFSGDSLDWNDKRSGLSQTPLAEMLIFLINNEAALFQSAPKYLGHWAGDRIEAISDEPDDEETGYLEIKSNFIDISKDVLQAVLDFDPTWLLDLDDINFPVDKVLGIDRKKMWPEKPFEEPPIETRKLP